MPINKNLALVTALGFSSGLPFLLCNATLGLWLAFSDVPLKLIGLTATIGLPYTLKFLWAPLFDEVKPLFWGRRRGWLLTVQAALILAIVALARSDPARNVAATLEAGGLVAFFSASQDILIDAWRIEIFEPRAQGAALAGEIWGYRIAMLVSGAGAIALSAKIGWHGAFMLMACFAFAGPVAVILAPEPEVARVAGTGGWGRQIAQAVWEPLREFLARRGAWLIIAFILLFRLGEALGSVMLSPYYKHLGFNRAAIALASGPFSLAATLAGAALGGVLVARLGVGRALLVATAFQTVVLVMYPALGFFPGHPAMLIATSVTESFAGAFADAAFLTYLSGLCDPEHTATQYALLSSIAPIALHTLGGFAGVLAARLGFIPFFVATSVAALPAMGLMLLILRYHPPAERRPA